MQNGNPHSGAGGTTAAKTATVQMSLWFNAETGHIHLAAPGSSWFITTVCNTPASKRGHPNLFGKLARLLDEAGLPGPLAQGNAAD